MRKLFYKITFTFLFFFFFQLVFVGGSDHYGFMIVFIFYFKFGHALIYSSENGYMIFCLAELQNEFVDMFIGGLRSGNKKYR